jgi:hypothetical protein
MLERVLAFSVRQRWLVLLATLAAAVAGAWSLTKLPIDAVPDVTNVQVQINAIAPALTPIEIEKQVTFPLETALAGTLGLETTRSFSRNGFVERRSLRAGDPTMPPRGAASATSATLAATSSAAMGWNRMGGSLTMFPSALESAMPRRNSMNWVARMIV